MGCSSASWWRAISDRRARRQVGRPRSRFVLVNTMAGTGQGRNRIRAPAPLGIQRLAIALARREYGLRLEDMRDTNGEGNGCHGLLDESARLHALQAPMFQRRIGDAQKAGMPGQLPGCRARRPIARHGVGVQTRSLPSSHLHAGPVPCTRRCNLNSYRAMVCARVGPGASVTLQANIRHGCRLLQHLDRRPRPGSGQTELSEEGRSLRVQHHLWHQAKYARRASGRSRDLSVCWLSPIIVEVHGGGDDLGPNAMLCFAGPMKATYA